MPMKRELYPADWEDIAREKKEAAAWKCEHCGKQCRKPGENFDTHVRTLTVHHIDGNPGNNSPENLTALCAGCHLAAHREMRNVSMKTIDETITGLCRCRYTSCRTCPYVGTKGKSCKEALLDDAADLLAQYRNGPRWIPIRQQPEEERQYLTFCRYRNGSTAIKVKLWKNYAFTSENENVFYWMPLPAAPEVPDEK